MVQPQIIFERLEENKRKVKNIKTLFKDGLKNSLDYQDTIGKIATLRDKKKMIEAGVKDQYKSELEKIDTLEMDIKADVELLGDAAITMLMKGEHVEVQDKYKNVYDPVFSVKFKKAK